MSRKAMFFCFFALLWASAHAQPAAVTVQDAWARATSFWQKSSGVFMSLRAREGATLIGVSSPVAGVAEVHEMKMDGQVMRMRAITALELPAGQAVALKPGGYHVMLMDLKTSLKEGSTVALTLKLRDAKGSPFEQTLQVPVQAGAGQEAHKH